MDILLTHGYFLQEDSHEQAVMKPYPPLGLLYLASHLESKGFRVQVFDTTFSTRQELEDLVQEASPPLVGVYCNLMTRASTLDLMSLCKRHGSDVIVGGPEPANYPQEYLRRGADVVVMGEGELTLEELLSRGSRVAGRDLQNVAGIAYRDESGGMIRTPAREHIADLDRQPFPDRSAVDIPRYMSVWRQHHKWGAVSLITSRGCPYTCSWCSHSVFGYSYRSRSPQNVAREVEQIVEQYRPDMLWYSDDVFTINHRWIVSYAEELSLRGLKVPFEAISREDRLDEEIVRTLAAMGCFRLWIGSESGSQRILDAMQRQADVQRVRQVVGLLQKYGIEAGLFIMLGYEGETSEDIRQTLEHLKETNPDLFLTTVAYPIKGTPYYEEVADRVVSSRSWEQGSDRDLSVAGRHSRRFYSFADRWIRGEVLYHRQRASSRPNLFKMARAWARGKMGRLGMLLTGQQREVSS